MTWNPATWRTRFATASAKRESAVLRGLRCQVFQGTATASRERSYTYAGAPVSVDTGEAYDDLHRSTAFHRQTDEIVVPASRHNRYATRVTVHHADFLEIAKAVAVAGETPTVLNMANGDNPGGGVLTGAGAQEENLFRRSNVLHSLYQYAAYHDAYGVPGNPGGPRYPIPQVSGGIWSPGVSVFRSSEGTGYAFLPRPYRVNVVTVPAINRPSMVERDGLPWLTDKMAQATTVKIRAILRIAAHHRSTALVLSAFGCGAFRHPPHHVAALFAEVLAEAEFAGVFRHVAFAIVDDHNAQRPGSPDGNYLPFERALARGL